MKILPGFNEIKIGVTYNPYSPVSEQAIFKNQNYLDFIEIKSLEPNLLISKKDILDKFPMKSMHVQYLSKQENPQR